MERGGQWDWLDRMAEALGDPAIGREEIGALLTLARDVAHGTERKLAPLSTFLAGFHAGRRTAEGMPREQALREVMEAAAALLPEPPS